ncbi:MAG: ABC transporter substrate-binding protein [Candidatus Omnitrophota bacterium]
MRLKRFTDKRLRAAGFLLAGFCLAALLSAVPRAHARPRYGGNLVIASTGDPKSFNPVMAKETTTSMVTNFIFEGLTRINAETLQPEANLARRWETSRNGRQWTFFLREDVLWNDGEPFTADDVVFTFNQLIYNDRIPSSARDIFTIDGEEFLVEKVSEHVVRFTLPMKFAPFLRAMTQEILPEHRLAEAVRSGEFVFHWGIDTAPGDVVGTGPFRLSAYHPGERIVFERNPHYWKRSREGGALPYLDGIIMLIVQNQDAVVLKFLEGEVDYCGVRGMDFPILKPLEEEKDFTVYRMGPDFGANFLVFNQNRGTHPETGRPYVPEHKRRWFTDDHFRRAVAHAVDRERMIAIIKNGLGSAQHAPMSPSAGFFYNADVPRNTYDLKKAADLLRQAGYRDRDGDGIIEDPQGVPVSFNLYTNAGNPEREQIAAMIRQDLEHLGMRVNFLGLEFNALISKLNATFEWDAVILGLTGGIEPHFGKNVWHSSGQLHLWYPMQESPATEWEARIDEIFVRGVQELDPQKRKELYDEWQVIVARRVPLIYTILGSNMFAVRDIFGNLNPTNAGAFHNVEEIYIRE